MKRRTEFIVYFDGACRNIKGHPTPEGIGVALFKRIGGADAVLVDEIACYGTELGTSYTAELKAMELAIRLAHFHYTKDVRLVSVFGDNQTVIKQYNREWNANNPETALALKECWHMAEQMKEVVVEWIPRHLNNYADKLSKMGRQAYLDEIGFDYDNAEEKASTARIHHMLKAKEEGVCERCGWPDDRHHAKCKNNPHLNQV